MSTAPLGEVGEHLTASGEGENEPWTWVDPSGLLERAGTWILVLPHSVGWYYKAVYTGHTLKKTDKGWLLILRATFGASKKVSFTQARSPAECVKLLAWEMRRKTIKWRTDLY